MRWTQDQLVTYESKIRGRKHAPTLSASPGVSSEKKLHESIVEFARAKGWICLHSGMHTKTTRMSGEPDFDIVADGGRRFWVECKTSTGKLSPEQLQFIAWAEKLGHRVWIVRSFEEFLKVEMATNPNKQTK